MPFDAAAAESALSWGPVPLPDGTRLWMRFADAEHEAEVRDGVVLFQGQAYSPNAFALAVTRRPTNAWSCVWVRRPGDADFRLADDLRAEARGEIRPPRSRPAPRRAAARKSAVLSLVPFLVRAGGLRDVGGDVLALLGGKRSTRPGLVSDSGLALDRALQVAIEAGYFWQETGARSGREAESLAGKLASAGRDLCPLSVNDLLDAIDQELRGSRVWPEGLAPAAEPDPAAEECGDAARWRRLVDLARGDGISAALSFLTTEAGLACDDVPF